MRCGCEFGKAEVERGRMRCDAQGLRGGGMVGPGGLGVLVVRRDIREDTRDIVGVGFQVDGGIRKCNLHNVRSLFE